MRRPRTSIASLACLVFVCAMAFASLRHASLGWSRAMLGVAIGVIGLACLRAWRGRAEQRPFSVGFAIVGGLYLLLTLSPGLGDRVAPNLPTTRLLERLYPLLYEPREESAALPRATFDQSFSAWSEAHARVRTADVAIEFYSAEYALLNWLMPAQEPFLRAGHAALGVVFGWLGGWLATLATALLAAFRRRSLEQKMPTRSPEPGAAGAS
jgi:hypothetical protein